MTPPAPQEPAAPVDASMRLLREVMEHPLDPAYALAADLRARGIRSGRSSVAVTLAVALVCGWVVARGVAELRRPEPGEAASRARLQQEISQRIATADGRQHQIQQLSGEIATAQQAQLRSDGDVALAAQVQQLSLLTGELPVSGPGLQIVLQDAAETDTQGAAVDPRLAEQNDQGRVLDHDLQITVNGLWGAGAEAVAINGRRLTTLSAIRSAGEAILVDFRPILPPYSIQAIGDPTGMLAQFNTELAASYLQSLQSSFGIRVSITMVRDLELPAAGVIRLQAAAVPSTGPAGPSGTSPAPSPSTGSGSPTSREVHQ